LESFNRCFAKLENRADYFSLHFIKNKEQQEVYFLLANDHKPIALVEAKLSGTQSSPALIKFQNALKVPAVQLVNQASEFRKLSNNGQKTLIAPACNWLAMLPLKY